MALFLILTPRRATELSELVLTERVPLFAGFQPAWATLPQYSSRTTRVFFGSTTSGGLFGFGSIFKDDFSGHFHVLCYLKRQAFLESLASDENGTLYGSRVFYPTSTLPLRLDSLLNEDIFSLRTTPLSGACSNRRCCTHLFSRPTPRPVCR